MGDNRLSRTIDDHPWMGSSFDSLTGKQILQQEVIRPIALTACTDSTRWRADVIELCSLSRFIPQTQRSYIFRVYTIIISYYPSEIKFQD
jgi:hypothetical protein